MCTLESIEKKQNILYPSEYKSLYKEKFVISGNRHKIYAGNDVFNINKFLIASEVCSIIDGLYDFFGYDLIPIAETDDGDYICLYYKDSRRNPSVAYWNYELAMENDDESISILYDSLSELLCELK